tara:strand:- start:6313 stop:6501 length:189 start_codon:yes stop_codon:yes gene_type:complete
MKLTINHQPHHAAFVLEDGVSRPTLLVNGDPVAPTELAKQRHEFSEVTVRDKVLLKAGGYKK